MKVRVQSIKLNRVGGPTELCGEREFTGPDAWSQANRQLREWGQTAPKGGAYDKCDFTVTWQDGETYEGRFDIQHPSYENASFSLADHMVQFICFHLGLLKPDHMTDDEYTVCLEVCPELAAELRTYWDKYDVPSPWADRIRMKEQGQGLDKR